MDTPNTLDPSALVEKITESGAQFTRAFPAQFIQFMANKGFDSAFCWLENNKCPDEILRLLEYSQFIYSRAADIKANTLSNLDLESIGDNLTKIIALVYRAGGTFGEGLDWSQEETGSPIVWDHPA